MCQFNQNIRVHQIIGAEELHLNNELTANKLGYHSCQRKEINLKTFDNFDKGLRKFIRPLVLKATS